MTEKEILEAIDKVKTRLSTKFKFGYYEKEDLEQEISILCMESLVRYDGRKPLANFFWVHCRNRLCNFKRNKYERLDKPCIGCPFFDELKQVCHSECKKYENKMSCDLYYNWFRRNEKKKNLVNKSGESHEYEPTIDADFIDSEEDNLILKIIDRDMPIILRDDFIKYKYGVRLNSIRMKVIREEINKICIANGIIDGDKENPDE